MFLDCLKRALTVLVILGLTGCDPILSVLLSKHPNTACKERKAALDRRIDQLRHNANEQLRPGTTKDAVTMFFKANGLPVVFTASEASGTIHVTGCSPKGCGNDDAMLRLRVQINAEGTVTGSPAVDSIYTDCL